MTFSLKAADRVSLGFIMLLMLLTCFFISAIPSWSRLLGIYTILAAGLIGVAIFRDKSGSGKYGFYLHVVFTVVMIAVLFNSLGELIAAVQPRTYDDVLIRIDYALFGVHPTIWMERFIHPALTAVLQFAYISYYFIPIALGVTLIAKSKNDDFEQSLFGIVLCFYLSYIGYLLIPAIGPRFTLDELQTASLQAGPFITAIRETVNGLEQNKTDAFPSGHTAVALVTLYYARKFKQKTLFRILLPIVFGLVISTVYLRYHYVIDVIAGISLAVFNIFFARKLSVWFSSASNHPANKRHHTP